jgi:hypothetical protein
VAQAIQSFAHMREQIAAVRGEADQMANAQQQGNAEPGLELRDAVADGTLGNGQFVRCLREAGVTGNRLEGQQAAQRG